MSDIMLDSDLKDIVICAIRYAIGRQTYMPSVVQEFVMRHPELIDERVKNILIRDIEEADHIREYTASDGTVIKIDGLGSTTIDRPGWLKFKKWLEEL